jgi:hypothetical protein
MKGSPRDNGAYWAGLFFTFVGKCYSIVSGSFSQLSGSHVYAFRMMWNVVAYIRSLLRVSQEYYRLAIGYCISSACGSFGPSGLGATKIV